jgi:hypothetical protein
VLPDAAALQTHAFCSCEQGFLESPDPRKEGQCCRCGRVAQPRKPLPELVEELFDSLAETLEGSGLKPRDMAAPEYDAFRAHTMHRVREGERLYGDRWRREDMIREACEELPDAAVYGFAQMVKDGERSADLFSAVVHAFQAYVCFRRYEARRKGSA